MKMMTKKLLALTLALLLTLSCAGCDILDSLTGAIVQKVIGVWGCETAVNADLVEEILTDLDFYSNEIACFELGGMKCVKIVEFREDKTYAYYYDVDASKALVKQYFNTGIEAIYDNRADLTADYGQEITAMTLEEFKQFYADLYELSSYDELLNLYVENSLDFAAMAEPFETGTYTVGTEVIMCTEDGDDQALGMEYEAEGDTLILTYTDGTECYTKRS